MNLQELRKESENIDDIEKVAAAFEKAIGNKQEEKFVYMKLILSKVYQKHLITERAQSLIAQIGNLRACIVSKNKEKGDRIIQKFSQSEYQIQHLISLHQQLGKEIEMLDELDEGTFTEHIEKLRDIHRKQKELLLFTSQHFIAISQQYLREVKELPTN